jgi:ribose/xylose/arabinose/galactoside ABC-type transport system permease subunit
MFKSLRAHPLARPLAIFLGCFALLALADRGAGNVLSSATAFSMLETFATGALVALGLGLAMMIREFDLSVAGVFSLAGCLMALIGPEDPRLAFAAALAAGVLVGAAQGLIIVRLRLSSVGVTLGGLLTCVGLAYVLTENRSLPYDNLEATMAVTRRMWGLFSPRSLVCLAIVALVAIVFGATRWRQAGGLAFGHLHGHEAVAVAGFQRLHHRMVRGIGLQQGPARPVGPAGAAGGLGQELIGAFGGAQVAAA